MATATRNSVRRLSALAAGTCLAAGAFAADLPATAPATTLPGTLRFAPVPISTLVSSREKVFRIAHEADGAARTSTLACDGDDGQPRAVARIVTRREGDATRITLQLERKPGAGCDSPTARVLTLENLYALTLRMEPEARFCIVLARGNCDAQSDWRTHPAALRELAGARRVAVEAAALPAAAWQVVSLAPAGKRHAYDEVSVRVTREGKPMPGITVFFHQAPHSSCSAATDRGGVAKCQLVDQHGDEHAHEGEVPAPVVVTYSGDVRADRALLPTTLVLSAPVPTR